MTTRVSSGSVITEVYFVVEPYTGAFYNLDGRYAEFQDAHDTAVDHYLDRKRVFREMELPELPPMPVVVERWLIEYPEGADPGGSVDMPISRHQLDRTEVSQSRIRRNLP